MLLGTPRNVTPGPEFGRNNWYGICTTPVRFFNLRSAFRDWINSSTPLTFSENRLNAALACKEENKIKNEKQHHQICSIIWWIINGFFQWILQKNINESFIFRWWNSEEERNRLEQMNANQISISALESCTYQSINKNLEHLNQGSSDAATSSRLLKKSKKKLHWILYLMSLW